MANLFEAAKDFLQINLDGEPKNPLHVGEVMSCWMYLALMDEATVHIQIALNSTNDDEVKQILKDSLDQCKTHSNRFKQLMKTEGIHQPPTSEERPNSDSNSVPFNKKIHTILGAENNNYWRLYI